MQLSRLLPAFKTSPYSRNIGRLRRLPYKARKSRGLRLEQLEDRRVLATFVVNTTVDLPDANPGDGYCDADPSPLVDLCTLRAAIQEANLNPGPDTILFNIPETDPGYNGQWWTISVNPLLINPEDGSNGLTPLIDSGTFIDGFSQPEATTDPEFGPNVNLVGTGGTVGVDAVPFPQFEQPEIAIDANTSDHGFSIHGAASDITLLGMAVYDVGPGSDSTAVRGEGGPGTDRVVQEMFIGLLPDGSDPGAERNKEFGVRQMSPGELTVTRCLVGFNGAGGLDGEASASVVFFTYNEVFENGWGTNSHDGIDVNGINGEARFNLTYNNRTLNNIPNGGGGNGIELGSNSAATILELNLIENNTSFGNLSAGISIRKGAAGNFVEKNIFYDNEVGISVNHEGRLPTNRNHLSQNSTYLNMGLGIDLQAIQNFVPPDAPETIPDLTDPDLTPEPWFGFANGGLPGPAVGPDGVTPNDPCDPDEGSNDLQNFPELTSALLIGSQVTVEGTLNSTPLTTFRIEFFATPITDMFGVADREGKRFIGSVLVTTDANCHASFSAPAGSADPESEVITATATKWTDGTEPWSTSEYGGPITINQIDLSAKVTGGGWIAQPAGATPAPSSTDDRASFGFVAMYKKDNPIPQGNTNFKYHPTKLHFHSTEYEELSLIVTGGEEEPQKARWRGLGKLNNKPGYGFKVNLTDNGEPGSMDSWRIKIWKDNDGDANTEDGPTIYDNGPAENETTLGGGNIQVHMKANGLELHADEVSSVISSQILPADTLEPVVAQAIAWWRNQGIDETNLATLADTQVLIAPLPDNFLGVAANGVIGIDQDAAGFGWSLDPSALGGVDLLTVVTHELGHLLGFEHDDDHDSVMAATLESGTRLIAEHGHLPEVAFATSSLPQMGAITLAVNLAFQHEEVIPAAVATSDTGSRYAVSIDAVHAAWNTGVPTTTSAGKSVAARSWMLVDDATGLAPLFWPANADLPGKRLEEIVPLDGKQQNGKRFATSAVAGPDDNDAALLNWHDESQWQLTDAVLAVGAKDAYLADGAAEESSAETPSSWWFQSCEDYFAGDQWEHDLRDAAIVAGGAAIVLSGSRAMRTARRKSLDDIDPRSPQLRRLGAP